MFVYLDNSSTTRQYDPVTDVMTEMMRKQFGNPSSLHHLGMMAEKEVKTARKSIAAIIGAEEGEVTFTSGGTESDNTALFCGVQSKRRQGAHLITSQIEHPAVLEACRSLEQQGVSVDYASVDENGLADLKQIEQMVRTDTILISLMHVNNEMGTIQPIEGVIALKQKFPDLLIHTDAVQSLGKVPIRLSGGHQGVDLLSVSGHKIHGPKGIGALYVRKGIHLPPYLYGGGQERGFRSGTEDAPAIAGFGEAARIAAENWELRTASLRKVREYLLKGILTEIPDVKINGFEDERCCPSILNVSFLGCRGEVLLHTLEQKEIYVSTGSACSSNSRKKGSRVLAAAGLSSEEIEGAIRFSFSEENTVEEMDYVLVELKKAVEGFRRLQNAFHGRKR